jgi:hypothetical protein
MAPVVLTDGTVPSRAEGLYLKLMLPIRGIQVLGPVERASLKLCPLPQGSFQRLFPENYIVRARNTPKTPVDLGRSVLPDHLRIIPKAFTPNLGPFGSGPPIQPLLSAQANFAETVDFSKFETPMLSLPSPDHRTSHLPFIIGPQTHVIPTYRPIPELPAAKHAPPAPTFGTSTAPFSPPGDATCKAAAKAADYDLKVKKMITIRSLKAAQGSHMLLCSQPIYWTTTKTSSSLPCAGGDRYSPTHLVNHPCTHSSAVQKLRRGRAQQDLCRRPATTRSSTTTVYQQRHSWAAIQALRRGVEKYPTELFRVCRAFLAALPSAREKQ